MYTTKRVKVDSIRFLLFEKGDLYSKIASVSILLLLCVVASSINEKEKKMRIIINLLVRCKETLQNNLA